MCVCYGCVCISLCVVCVCGVHVWVCSGDVCMHVCGVHVGVCFVCVCSSVCVVCVCVLCICMCVCIYVLCLCVSTGACVMGVRRAGRKAGVPVFLRRSKFASLWSQLFLLMAMTTGPSWKQRQELAMDSSWASPHSPWLVTLLILSPSPSGPLLPQYLLSLGEVESL